MNHRIVWESDDEQFRILEIPDMYADMDSLKGDSYNAAVNTATDPERLAKEERHFEELVEREGVFGYVLERWNPAPGCGYEHVDSCWGFVGQYTPTDPTFNHYIVDELKATATKDVA